MSGFSNRQIDDRQIRQQFDDQQRALRRATGDDALFDANRRLILRSPDGHFWSVTVSNLGALATTDLGTTLP